LRHADQSRYPDALSALLERMASDFARVLYRFRIPAQDTEDLLQELVVQFLENRARVESPEAWLVGTLKFRCALYWRKRRRSLVEAIDGALLDELAGGAPGRQENDDLSRDLCRAIDRLSERCRSFIRLRYGLGYENPEVAEQLGYSKTGIRKISSRCLDALTDQILAVGPPAEALGNG
jgi:RNA polymerase sigma factor (sigma-70 family)